MPVPKRKHSRARRDKKHANKGLDVKTFTSCTNCNVAKAPHIVCKECGFYNGKKVLRTKSDRGLVRDELRKVQETKRKAQEPASAEASSADKQ